MLETAKSNVVSCKFQANRFVVHDHVLTHDSASLLEKLLVSKYDWLYGMWVDCDPPLQFTVKFEPYKSLPRLTDEQQKDRISLLIADTLEFIRWSVEETTVFFDEF